MNIESGKRYMTRNGRLTGPVEACINPSEFADFAGEVCESRWTWSSDGKFGKAGEHPLDLVAEYHGPAKPSEQPADLEDILAEALRLTTGDRQQDYGPPDECCAKIAAMWQALKGVPFEARDVPLLMICVKLVRETHASKRDNSVDLAGYARILDLCNRAKASNP